MTHERHADLLHDAGFHEAGVKRVAEIMETHVADSGIFQCCLPGALHDANRTAAKVDHQAVGFALLKQKLVQAFGQRNLSGFAFGSLRARNEEDLS